MSSVEFNVSYSPRQKEANEAQEQFVLYGGAKGGGKSWWLCCWAMEQCLSFPGNRGFLGRKRGVDFNNTTLETWKKAIPAELYKINEQKKRIFVPPTESYIDYGGLDSEEDVQKFNSAEYGFFGIDQAEEIDRDSFSMLRGTLRHRLPDGSESPYRVRLTANPAQCWLKDDFILRPRDGFRFIKALPSDNPFLAEGYIKNLEEAFRHRPELLQAYLYGSWDELAGSDIIIQPDWVRFCQRPNPTSRIIKIIVICDPARFGDDETVIYVMAQTADLYCFILDTEIVHHKTLMDTAGRIITKKVAYGANLIAIDTIGIGAGIADRLIEQNEEVLQFMSSQKPTSEPKAMKYFNLRAQIWFEGGQKIFERMVCIPNDDGLINQLSMTHYEFMSNGRLKAESKEDIKTRHGVSTDRADAFLMGLHTLDIADELKKPEDDEIIDRVGRGIPVSNKDNTDYCYDEF